MNIRETLIFANLGSTAVALGATPIVAMMARRMSLVDVPNVRKIHSRPIPRIGGLGIALGVIAPLILIYCKHWIATAVSLDEPQLRALLICSLVIFGVGLIDDIWNLPAKFKLVALLGTVSLFCALGGMLKSVIVHGQLLLSFETMQWPITAIWIVGVVVSVNFIDGLDGLAAGIVAIAAGVLALSAGISGDLVTSILATALMGSLTGFLFYNFNPARIFMGDCGSMFISFMLAACCVMSSQKIGTYRSIVLPSLVLSIPIVDTGLTVIRRGVLQRRSIFAAERGHIHHRLLDIGLCHRHVVLLLYLVTTIAASLAAAAIFLGPWATIVAVILVVVGIAEFFRSAGSVRARETLGAVRRNRALQRENRSYRQRFEDLQLRFRDVRTFDDWWQHVCDAAEILDFVRISLPLRNRDGTERNLNQRTSSPSEGQPQYLTARVPLRQRRSNEAIYVEVDIIAGSLLESATQRLSLFSRLLTEHSLECLPTNTANQAITHVSNDTNGHVESSAESELDSSDAASFARSLKIAIVHDFLYTYAGAERVLEQIVRLFPHADIFSLFDFLPAEGRQFIQNKAVKTSFLQKMPFAKGKHRAYLPLMPLAIEQLDLSKYDLVLSSSYLAAKGVITGPNQLHLCYCHTPVRFAWDLQNHYLGRPHVIAGLKAAIARLILHYIRTWDVRTANGVDEFLTNSHYVARRIQKIYRRTSTIVYPPVDVEHFQLCEDKHDYYFTASRMVPYKRLDLIVEAFRLMPGRRLIVAGDGPEMARLRGSAGTNVQFLGHAGSDALRQHMQHAKAFIFAAEEDFGITPVEAQACGTPVIAYGRGGVTESVIDGVTGLFFHEQSAASISATVNRFDEIQWDAATIRAHAESFSPERFRDRFKGLARDKWAAFQAAKIADASRSESLIGARSHGAKANEFDDAGGRDVDAVELA